MREAAARVGVAGRVREALRPLENGADIRRTLEGVFELICAASRCESVGIRWNARDDYPYLLTRGFGRDFVVMEGPLCARDAAGLMLRHRNGTPRPACMCGAVIQGRTDPPMPFFTDGGSFWTNGTTALLRDTPPSAVVGVSTRNYCNAVSYESVALIPLRVDEQRYGLLQLNSRAPGRFTEERIAAYERVAADIASAMAKRIGELPDV